MKIILSVPSQYNQIEESNYGTIHHSINVPVWVCSFNRNIKPTQAQMILIEPQDQRNRYSRKLEFFKYKRTGELSTTTIGVRGGYPNRLLLDVFDNEDECRNWYLHEEHLNIQAIRGQILNLQREIQNLQQRIINTTLEPDPYVDGNLPTAVNHPDWITHEDLARS